MRLARRGFDIVLAGLLAILLWPVAIGVALAILLLDGAPVFHVSERMQSPTRAFRLVKFRTMRPDARDRGVSGGDKAGRVTPLGAVLRRTRLDELPQLWNILRGDMGFVGPRPPLREYVERFPALYGAVLAARPGLTGFATLVFHAREEALLSGCASANETDLVYVEKCIPAKARLDLMYEGRRTLVSDLSVLLSTIADKAGRELRAARPVAPAGPRDRTSDPVGAFAPVMADGR